MRTLTLFLVIVVTFTLVTPVHADIAPPAEPPGANPVPGSASTQVRMVEETVRIEIQAQTRPNSLGQARVAAEFIMHNMGKTDESMAVRFPLGTPDGWGDIAVIDKIDAKVDGRQVAVRTISGPLSVDSETEVPWAEFDVVFPVGRDVRVTVEYTLEGAGETPYIWFNYIFSTGAGWKDSIGKAVLTVAFPYAVNEVFLLNCIDSSYGCTVPGGEISGSEITWTYEDFEPQPEDNFMIAFAAPSVWLKVLAEEGRVAAAPQDGEAWGRLGKLYKSLIFSPHGWRGFRNYYYLADPGVEQLFQLADRAYTQAVMLLPDDALWHAGYAELLGYYAAFAGYEGENTLSLKIKALQEIHRALELAPEDETVKEIATGLTWPLEEGLVYNGGEFDFPWLTATPIPTARTVEISTSQPTLTPTFRTTPTTTPREATSADADSSTSEPGASGGSLPLCGGGLALPFVVILMRRKLM